MSHLKKFLGFNSILNKFIKKNNIQIGKFNIYKLEDKLYIGLDILCKILELKENDMISSLIKNKEYINTKNKLYFINKYGIIKLILSSNSNIKYEFQDMILSILYNNTQNTMGNKLDKLQEKYDKLEIKYNKIKKEKISLENDNKILKKKNNLQKKELDILIKNNDNNKEYKVISSKNNFKNNFKNKFKNNFKKFYIMRSPYPIINKNNKDIFTWKIINNIPDDINDYVEKNTIYNSFIEYCNDFKLGNIKQYSIYCDLLYDEILLTNKKYLYLSQIIDLFHNYDEIFMLRLLSIFK